MDTETIHVGYYVRRIHEGARCLLVGQGPLLKAIALTHLSPCFAVFANVEAPGEEGSPTLSKVVRDPRTGALLETFARPVDINSVVGWLLLGGDHYIRASIEAINRRGLVPFGEGRSLWFEFDRTTGVLVRESHSAFDRMEKAWTEPWPEGLVMTHFYGGHRSLDMLTNGAGVAGLGDLVSP